MRTENRIMKSHTNLIGYEVGPPSIQTTCTIISQEPGIDRRRRILFHSRGYRGRRRRRHMQQQSNNTNTTNTTSTSSTSSTNSTIANNTTNTTNITDTNIKQMTLVINYIMEWSTRYQYDVESYPDDFRVYMNENNGTTFVTIQEKLQQLGIITTANIHVKGVGATVFFDALTLNPTQSPITPAKVQTLSPTPLISTSPSTSPSISTSPSASYEPTVHKWVVGSVSENGTATDGVSGILIGVLVAFIIVGVSTFIAIAYRYYRNKHANEEEHARTVDIGKAQFDNGEFTIGGADEMRTSRLEGMEEARGPSVLNSGRIERQRYDNGATETGYTDASTATTARMTEQSSQVTSLSSTIGATSKYSFFICSDV